MMKHEHLVYRESPPMRFVLASMFDRGVAFMIDIVLFDALLAAVFIVIQLLKLPKNWFSPTFNFYAAAVISFCSYWPTPLMSFIGEEHLAKKS